MKKEELQDALRFLHEYVLETRAEGWGSAQEYLNALADHLFPKAPKDIPSDQPIETPTEHLLFIGQCGMFIMQELMLYVFENIGPRE